MLLAVVFKDAFDATRPLYEVSFESCYEDLVAQVANTGYVFHQLFEFQELEVDASAST